jgi:hypothetical protein
MSIAGILWRWVLVSAVTGVLALIQVPGVRAQAVQPVPIPPNPNQPVPMAPSPGPLNSPAYGDTGAPGMAPGTPPQVPLHSPTGLSPLEVIYKSLTDEIYSPEAQKRWTPLPLSTFFTEGWDQPYVLPTGGDGGLAGTGEGSPRFGWINEFGGINYRAWFFELFYANNILGPHYRSNGNQYILDWTIFVPFNRRFEIQFDWLTIYSNKGGANNTYHGNMGDTTISPRFQLSESKNFGQLFQVHFRTPTGAHDNGNGVASVAPEYSFWWNAYGPWVVRGATSVTVPTNHAKTSGYTDYNNRLGIGRYFKGRDDAWLHNAQLYLLAEEDSTTAGSPRRESFFSLLPGFLTQVGKKLWFAYGGIEVPMVGPKAYTYQMIFAVVHAY